MHKLLRPFICEDLCYLDRSDLVERLKKTDLEYFIDDINYLSAPSVTDDSYTLCGYLPGTDPTRNFCYITVNETRDFPNPGDVSTTPPKLLIVSCRDKEVLHKYLSLFEKQKPQLRISLNLPAVWETELDDLLELHRDSYVKGRVLYDMRFESRDRVLAPPLSEVYRVVPSGEREVELLSEMLQNMAPGDRRGLTESYLRDIQSDTGREYFSMYKDGRLLFTYVVQNWDDRKVSAAQCIGKSVMSFSNQYIKHVDEEIDMASQEFFLRFLSERYVNKGFIVKNVAFDNHPFENEEVCRRLGMVRYRQFVSLLGSWLPPKRG